MVEGIVLFICLTGNAGCGEATTAYYDYNTYAQRWVKTMQYNAEEKYGKQNLVMAGTALGLVFVRKGTINLHNHVNLVVDDSSAQIQLHWDQ